MVAISEVGESGLTVLPLALQDWAHIDFGAGDRSIDDALSRRYFRDLTAMYDVRLSAGTTWPVGNTFVAMAEALLDAMPHYPSVDVAVVAHATPDLDPRHSVVTFLADALPGRPTTFTVTGCGAAAVHTLLRVVAAYSRRNDCRRALALLLDQATLPYDTDRHLAGDSGVAMLLSDGDAGAEITLHDAVDLEPEEVEPRLRAGLRALPAPTVVAGPGLAGDDILPKRSGDVRVVPDGYPATGALGVALDAGGDVVLADHEADRRELRLCRIRSRG